MVNSELEMLKQEIDALREQIYAYMEYPEIFRDELLESSSKIDILINKYMALTSKYSTLVDFFFIQITILKYICRFLKSNWG